MATMQTCIGIGCTRDVQTVPGHTPRTCMLCRAAIKEHHGIGRKTWVSWQQYLVLEDSWLEAGCPGVAKLLEVRA